MLRRLRAQSRSLITVDSFHQQAPAMRAHFEERFRNPRAPRGDRFVWDWWHVPDQYTALRTPAYEFFPEKMYERFHRRLVLWGREHLGAHDVSPPWMSCYIDGCRQELHGDLPHGPWAYVYSLTPWRQRRFAGGETILLREETLSHWRQNALRAGGLERGDIVRAVPALFNRLAVFDPRIPHGVREVEGPRDVLDGRLVIHGWFVQPRPFIEGSLEESELADFIAGLGERLQTVLGSDFDASGTFSFRIHVAPSGKVSKFAPLASTLRDADGGTNGDRLVARFLSREVVQATFTARKSGSRATVPLLFQTESV